MPTRAGLRDWLSRAGTGFGRPRGGSMTTPSHLAKSVPCRPARGPVGQVGQPEFLVKSQVEPLVVFCDPLQLCETLPGSDGSRVDGKSDSSRRASGLQGCPCR